MSAVDRNRGLGVLMRQLRKTANVTQAQAAQAMGLERTSVCNIEAGLQPLNIEKLVEFGDAIDADVTVTFRPRQRGKWPAATAPLASLSGAQTESPATE